MICPVCSKRAVSFSRFLWKIYPEFLVCRHCGNELIWTEKWKRVFHWNIVLCIISALILATIFKIAGISFYIYIAIGIVSGVIFSGFFWNRSEYRKTQRPPAPEQPQAID